MNKNEELFMNDTFDNFEFTGTTQKFINVESKPTAQKTENSNLQACFDDSIYLSQWDTQNFVSENTSDQNNKPLHEHESGTNVSLVDSIFFSSWSETNDDSSTKVCSEESTNNQLLADLENKHEESVVFVHNQSLKLNNSSNENAEYIPIEKNISLNNSDQDPPLNLEGKEALSKWGLPEPVMRRYEAKNIKEMFPWQVECLSKENVLKNCTNLVYSAPTSAGKTLVAEILALKTVLERKKKVIIILPFVSVVREKTFYFQDLLEESAVRVEGFMGSYNPPGGFDSVKIAICTIEKANSLINRLLEEKNLEEIGCVVLDEIHLLGDSSRGYLLELLLTKLKYVSEREANVNIQIIGMSATLPNLDLIAKWLDAELYTTQFRPIPLYEQAFICGEFYNNKMEVTRRLNPLPELGVDTDNILQLCLETIQENCSVLIFCPSKNWCENLSQQISAAFFKIGSTTTELGLMLRQQLNTELIMEVLEQLKASPIGLDDVLKRTVSFGVGFHHAGLTMDERDIIEGAFRNMALRVLVATSTLSSGVNLPARRVIIRSPKFYGRPIDCLTYRQMIGRAGRMGKDTQGESLLICQKNELNIAKELMQLDLKPVESCLEGSGKLKRAILEVIASGVASTPEDVQLFTNCTLLAASEADSNNNNDIIKKTLEFLIENEFIRLQTLENGGSKYVSTALAKACLSSSLPPEEGLSLFEELEKARRCFVLETELHLIYLVTPYSACYQWGNLDWMLFLDLWTKLPASMLRVGELIGIKESYMVSASRGKIRTDTPQLNHKLLVHKRFFVSLVLQDLVNEKTLTETCDKYNCNRGMLQGLQQSAATFAGMVTAFSRQLRWTSVEILISQFQDRLQYGVSRDLLDLMRIPILNGQRARSLYDSGIETLVDLANSDVNVIENILHKVVPFESGKEREGVSKHELKEKNKLRNIWISGKQGLTEKEAAQMLIKHARKFLQNEMGLAKAEWEHSIKDCAASSDDGTALNKSIYDENTTVLSDESLFEESYDSLNLNITSNKEASSPIGDISKKRRNSNCATTNNNNNKKIKPNLNSEERSLDFTKFEIVDVCKDVSIFEAFKLELNEQKIISFAVACSNLPTPIIGADILNNKAALEVEVGGLNDGVKQIEGISFCWGGNNTVYYLNFSSYYVPLIKTLLKRKFNDCTTTFKALCCKDHLKILNVCLGRLDFEFNVGGACFEDPKVAAWLLDPEAHEKNLTDMVREYVPEAAPLSELAGVCKGVGSVALNTDSAVSSRIRASIESLINFYLVDAIKEELSADLCSVFEVEMKCISCLAKMETTGIRTDDEKLKNVINLLKNQLRALEQKAHSLAGRKFSFKSSKEVASVIGIKTRNNNSSTRKEVLKKNEHPISVLVLEWRKLHCILTKMIVPLQQSIKNDYIFGTFLTFNATGRITMQEPNLQNIAKDFDITDPLSGAIEKVSLRSVFIPRETFVFISADYCQIELRLLAHFSEDRLLCKILQQEGDIFKRIAAKWNRISQTDVSDLMRQQTKQICYGIIYGMGSKTLSEQLCVSEEVAMDLMEGFHTAFPRIKPYIKTTVEKCKLNGFVETLFGRKRFLPHINGQNPALKSQAERQAINTTIQGSAADIAKKAMVDVEQTFETLFHDRKCKPQSVLHMHDELIYEVPLEYLNYASNIIKNTMEQAVDLSVPFPVKLRKGYSWGDLTEFVL